VRSGRRLAIDVGKVRIGIAASDQHSILASGIETVQRDPDLRTSINRIQEIIGEVQPIEIYIGLPISMQGHSTDSTRDAIEFAKALAGSSSIPIRFIDERMTTISAANSLKLSGRSSKSGRKVIDQIAATVILEQALEIEKLTGNIPGLALGEVDE
jgi:putative Holliday junction resolvase